MVEDKSSDDGAGNSPINVRASRAVSVLEANKEKDEPVILATNPTPPILKYVMSALLAVSVLGVTLFAVIHQNSVKPPADPSDCTDPVSENRLRDAVRTNPNDYQSLVQLGSYSYSCTKDFVSAISAYSQAVVIADKPANKISDDDWMQAHLSLGLSYLSNHNPDKALDQFKVILDKDPNNPNALLFSGMSDYALDPQHPQIALGYWQKVVKQSPGTDTAQKAQELIDYVNKPDTAGPQTTPSK